MPRSTTHRYPEEVRAILSQTGLADPEVAIRQLAQQILADYHGCFAEAQPPYNMEALASFRSIRLSPDQPMYSEDAELAPDGRGGVIMRINQDRPRTRKRFSMGHEIGHTLFPGYQTTIHCRKGLNRDWADPKDLIESLCDAAASEFLFPDPWFSADAKSVSTATSLIDLAQKYDSSPDATVRRFVQVWDDPRAVIFFRWKHKPTERRRADAKNQRYIFGSRSAFQPERKLRVEYAVTNDAFDELGKHIPTDKSVAEDSVIFQASKAAECLDSVEALELGPLSGRFSISAFPIFTAEEDRGPDGERSVGALIIPAKSPSRRRPKRPR